MCDFSGSMREKWVSSLVAQGVLEGPRRGQTLGRGSPWGSATPFPPTPINQHTAHHHIHTHTCKDRSESHRLTEPDYPFEVFDSIGLDLTTKGPRMAMCRFNSIEEVLSYNLLSWHSRLLVFLYIGVAMGWVKSMSSALSCDSSFVVSEPLEGDSKQNMHTTFKANLAKARKDAKNTLHFCTGALLDCEWHREALCWSAMSGSNRYPPCFREVERSNPPTPDRKHQTCRGRHS